MLHGSGETEVTGSDGEGTDGEVEFVDPFPGVKLHKPGNGTSREREREKVCVFH